MLTDSAITKYEDDELNRSEFTKNLGNLINNYNDKECLVLGLIGEWGSGKTSLINLTLKEIDKKHIIIKFNPWLFSEQKNLILQFFNELENGIKTNNKQLKKHLEKIKEKLHNFSKNYSKTLTVSFPLPDGMNKVDVSGTLTPLNNRTSDETLEEFKTKINEELLKLNDTKLIIIIDDIDRLNDLEVKQIFQLVKSLANFKNIIYILPFDKKVVLKSLEDTQIHSPEEYLEKIIQIQIDVPKIEKNQLQNYFDKQLIKLFKDKKISINDKDFITISHNLMLFIKNIRDIKRYLNNLNFYLDFLKSELNIGDYLLILALQVFENEIYNDIKLNKNLFSGIYNSYERENKEVPKENIEQIIKKNKRVPKHIIKNILVLLFPKLNFLYNNTIYGNDWLDRWNKELNIASPKNFDKYFTLTIPENEISTIEFNNIINSKTLDDLEQQAFKLDKQGKSRELLKKINLHSEDISINSIYLLIEFILKNGDDLNIPYKGMWNYNKDQLIPSVLEQILFKIENQTERFDLIKKCIEENSNSLFTPIIILYYEKNNKTPRNIINKEQQEEIDKIILKKIKLWEKENKLINSYNLDIILEYWSIIETKEEVERFIKKTLKEENTTIQLIKGFTLRKSKHKLGEIYETNYITFTFNTMEELIDLNYVKKEINKIKYSDKNKELIEEFNEELVKYMQNK